MLTVALAACAASAGSGTGSSGQGAAGARGGASSSGQAASGGSAANAGDQGAGGSMSGSDNNLGAGSGGSSAGSGGGGGSSTGSGAGSTGGTKGSGGNGAGGGMGTSGGTGMGGTGGGSVGKCSETMPPVTDYSMNGPYMPTTIQNTGPSGMYTIVQPTTLGQNGFKHPIATWGNGITTTPSYYPNLLNLIASHGFVVIAANSSSVTTQNMTDGLDWMIMQNGMSGQYQDKLDAHCLVAIGYSLGGGAAVGAGAHPDIVTTVSFHGVTGNSAGLKAPLLLFTSETDTFVTPSGFVTPTFNASVVQTFYATLTKAGDPSNQGHLLPVSILDPNCPEYAPALAWLRLWVYGDQGGKTYFYGGSSATLCKAPWTCQTKMPGGSAQMSGFQ